MTDLTDLPSNIPTIANTIVQQPNGIDPAEPALLSSPLCSGFGQFHTDHQDNRNPKPYASITLADITRLAKNPQQVNKEVAQWFIPSSLHTRNANQQRANGLFYAVWVDIDQHTTLDKVKVVLAYLGVYALIYSSRSSTEQHQKWRVILPLAEPANAGLWVMMAAIVNDWFQDMGIQPDRASERVNQICYLPNQGEFYQSEILSGQPLGVDAIADELAAKVEAEQAAQGRLQAATEQARLKATQRMAQGEKSPIKAFNHAYPVEQCLEQYGYQRRGNKWISPNSESGKAGVIVKNHRWLSSHTSDAGIGKLNTHGCSGDAFDLFAHYEHGGNRNAALKAAGAMFKMPDGKTITQHNQQAYMASKSGATVDDFDNLDALEIGNAAANALLGLNGDYDGSGRLKQPPQPAATHNAILDDERHYCAGDFLRHIPDYHILKRLSMDIAKATYMPVHTVFLAGLGVVSAITSRVAVVKYRSGHALPLGVYAVAEQPSGSAKSRVVGNFQAPAFSAISKVRGEILKHLDEAKSVEEPDKKLIKALESMLLAVNDFFITNSTPEALDDVLKSSHGFFSCISSEQGLFNSLFGVSYGDSGKANNNDVVLNGFDGGYVSTKRVGRVGYSGHATGAVVTFAQSGSIETILKASGGIGLAERFLYIAEKHALGTRDFKNYHGMNQAWKDEYQSVIEQLVTTYFEKLDAEKTTHTQVPLKELKISNAGWNAIDTYRNQIEPQLADGKKYSHIAIRGAVSKVDMQIMKIAANLHLLSALSGQDEIPLEIVNAAIGVANGLLENMYQLCQDKGIIGVRAEYQAILALFENDQKPRSERVIIQAKNKTKPFKEHTGNKSELIKTTLAEMVKEGVLKVTLEGTKKMFSPAQ